MSDAVTVALIAAVASIVGPVVLYLVTNRRHRDTQGALASNTAKTDEVLEQVRNSHTSNLRHDVDQLAATLERIEAGQAQLGGMVTEARLEAARALEQGRQHAAASALIVGELRARDDQLQAELRRHHAGD